MQTVCAECGRVIDDRFVFCPWCGVDRTRARTGEHTGEREADRVYARERRERLSNMEKTLAEIEQELLALTGAAIR